ncbi:DsrE-related protein [Desulfonatronum sp. SC1]|uniref:DsrE-related protein n=1 Tax=Desulfonatronum sp. SC1 TaxID=2109626 RepID=UPI0018EEB80C|nr:DsrE-related protein [Desulfonatronum sp. SC1]
MILPQLKQGGHGLTVVGMFFFVDNTFMLVKGNDIGERLTKISQETGILIMACDKWAFVRKINDDLVAAARLGCFPDLHAALKDVALSQVITL